MELRLELTEENLKELDQLQVDCGFPDRKTLVNNALSVFKWVVESLKQGRPIAAIDEPGQKYRELEMPFMANLKPRSSPS